MGSGLPVSCNAGECAVEVLQLLSVVEILGCMAQTLLFGAWSCSDRAALHFPQT